MLVDVVLSVLQGNPLYQSDIVSRVLDSIQTADSLAQQAGAQLVTQIVGSISRVDLAWIPKTLCLFRTLQMHVQYEGAELLKAFAARRETTEFVLQAVIKMIRKDSLDPSDPDYEVQNALMCSQQAAVSKLIAALTQSSQSQCDRLVELSVVKYLLAVSANRHHFNGQRV
jgi:hypothetical protein